MLVKSVQNRLISSEICPENSHEIGHFLPIVSAKLALKISANLSQKIPQNLPFFSRPIRSPVVWHDPSDLIV